MTPEAKSEKDFVDYYESATVFCTRCGEEEPADMSTLKSDMARFREEHDCAEA
jgi:hypothetical protein